MAERAAREAARIEKEKQEKEKKLEEERKKAEEEAQKKKEAMAKMAGAYGQKVLHEFILNLHNRSISSLYTNYSNKCSFWFYMAWCVSLNLIIYQWSRGSNFV